MAPGKTIKATIRKRTWTSPDGTRKQAWQVSYFDRNGKRHQRQFPKKSEADAERIRIEGELARGVHVPDRDSITVLDAARAWLADFEELVEDGKRERSTFTGYDIQVNKHIAAYPIAAIRLARLGGPDVKAFARAIESDLSATLSPRVMTALRRIVEFAQGEGWIGADPTKGISVRTGGKRYHADEADKIAIPPKDQLRALFKAAAEQPDKGRALAMVHVMAFGGLRASEIRGLRRKDLSLSRGEITVRQRADQWNAIGPTKTENSRRTVPIPAATVAALKVWLLAAPPSETGLVFPNGIGKPESYTNIYHRLWTPLMRAAGLADVTPSSQEGQPDAVRPWWALHMLRHVAVSLWIEQRVEPKQIQEWAGHASITFTLDRYGHLWPNQTASNAVAQAAEKSLLG